MSLRNYSEVGLTNDSVSHSPNVVRRSSNKSRGHLHVSAPDSYNRRRSDDKVTNHTSVISGTVTDGSVFDHISPSDGPSRSSRENVSGSLSSSSGSVISTSSSFQTRRVRRVEAPRDQQASSKPKMAVGFRISRTSSLCSSSPGATTTVLSRQPIIESKRVLTLDEDISDRCVAVPSCDERDLLSEPEDIASIGFSPLPPSRARLLAQTSKTSTTATTAPPLSTVKKAPGGALPRDRTPIPRPRSVRKQSNSSVSSEDPDTRLPVLDPLGGPTQQPEGAQHSAQLPPSSPRDDGLPAPLIRKITMEDDGQTQHIDDGGGRLLIGAMVSHGRLTAVLEEKSSEANSSADMPPISPVPTKRTRAGGSLEYVRGGGGGGGGIMSGFLRTTSLPVLPDGTRHVEGGGVAGHSVPNANKEVEVGGGSSRRGIDSSDKSAGGGSDNVVVEGGTSHRASRNGGGGSGWISSPPNSSEVSVSNSGRGVIGRFRHRLRRRPGASTSPLPSPTAPDGGRTFLSSLMGRSGGVGGAPDTTSSPSFTSIQQDPPSSRSPPPPAEHVPPPDSHHRPAPPVSSRRVVGKLLGSSKLWRLFVRTAGSGKKSRKKLGSGKSPVAPSRSESIPTIIGGVGSGNFDDGGTKHSVVGDRGRTVSAGKIAVGVSGSGGSSHSAGASPKLSPELSGRKRIVLASDDASEAYRMR